MDQVAWKRLLERGPILTDGAWGTQLQALGLPVGACPDAWNLERPEVVGQVPKSYVAAGSQIVLTNTFRANRIALASHGVSRPVEDINRAAVEISRQAGPNVLVFASIGPSGKMLLTGDVTEEELFAAFAEQAEALATAGADALVIETMSDLSEALIALAAARPTGLPIVVSMVFDSGADRDRTMMGNRPEEIAQALTEAGAHGVGANCGQGIEGFIGICGRLRAATDLPIWIKANAGLPILDGTTVRYPTKPAEFAEAARTVLDAGANFIGGCCGTSPEFIQSLAQILHS